MKNKIKKFSKGDFQIERPEVVFPETHIQMMIGEGEVYSGSFIIQNQKDGDIRGIVYSSSFRIQCSEQGFEGNPVKINFTYDAAGLKPGQMERGKFTVMCSGGEYELTFTAMIEKPFIMTSYGKIQNVEDFKRLAMKDFSEARRLFRTRQFYDVLKYEELRVKNLYDNMRKWALDEEALEEFLVGIKQKEKIFLTLSDEERQLQDVLEETKDWIEITKNTWGFVPIRIWADGAFIQIRDEEITTDDFVGDSYRLEYSIKEKKLHAGKNYGRIFIETPYEVLHVDVLVCQHVSHNHAGREKELLEAQGLKEYLSCISGKLSRDEWMEKEIEKAKRLRDIEQENEYYLLMQAHIYLYGGKREEARWILENFNYNRFAIGKKPEISAYYLFLTALLREDTNHTNRVLEELNRLYIKYPYSWQLLCMLVNLDPKYKSDSERFRILERQFYNGTNHILFYAEAYLCLKNQVILLRKLGDFEIQVLNFAVKYKLITRELAEYAAELISHQKEYDKRLHYILERLYKIYAEQKVLNAICVQLIKGNKTGASCFKWYEKAVKQELKIAQLYEYYMMSIDGRRLRRALPRIVYLYFMHGNHLDDQRASILYANILTYEDEESEIYQYYQEEMEVFAWNQLLKRQISEELRIIYNRFLVEEKMNPERLDALYDICHAYWVRAKKSGVKYVIVIEKDGTIRQRVAYSKKGAKIYLYDENARIVWEAKNGMHYTESIPYDAKRMLYEVRFLEMCKKRMTDRAEQEMAKKVIPVTFENLKTYGLQAFDEREVFLMCTKKIREEGSSEDDFLLYLSFEVMKRGYYDKALLTYLATFYCGATRDMKLLWKRAKEYDVETHALSERIISQMLFSETLFSEEAIFEDYYYEGNPYFRLKQAYLAYVSKEFVVLDRKVSESIFTIIVKEYEEKEYIADICKVAILKYYADRTTEHMEYEEMLRGFLREMCEKRLVFSSYLSYPENWLREVQLYDKVIVEYHATLDSKVKIVYQINRGEMEKLDYQSESLLPMYGTVFAKEFILYKDEILKYYFKETRKDRKIASEKMNVRLERDVCLAGKFGQLNSMIDLSDEEKKTAMESYQQEEEIAEQIFQTY